MNVSTETNKGTDDGAMYTVWVGGSEVNDYYLDHAQAVSLANSYLELGYTDVTLMLANADEVYGI